MKIELRISPVHLYLVTPSDKSFLLWKRNLWCIIWFSLWKWPFILYASCCSRGAPAPFRFMVGRFRVDVVNLNHSVRYESLVMRDVFIRETRLHPNQLYMSISGFIIVGQPWIQLQFTNTWSAWHSPRFRALPPTTVIIIIQSNRYCSH